MSDRESMDRDGSISEWIQTARARWSDAQWDDDILTKHFCKLLDQGLDPAHEEMLLALACLHRDPQAIRHLEERYICDIEPNLKNFGLDDSEVDEVLQRLRERLLAPASGSPRLANYLGQGHLGGFVRAVAVRLALDLRREPQQLSKEIMRLIDSGGQDPELLFMKEHYASSLEEAVRVALEQLNPRQRLFLHHQLTDHLSIDALAKLYGIHRSTAARRCASAREALVRFTRRQMRNRLGVGAETLDSIVQLLSSRIELTMVKVLDDDPEKDENRQPSLDRANHDD